MLEFMREAISEVKDKYLKFDTRYDMFNVYKELFFEIIKFQNFTRSNDMLTYLNYEILKAKPDLLKFITENMISSEDKEELNEEKFLMKAIKLLGTGEAIDTDELSYEQLKIFFLLQQPKASLFERNPYFEHINSLLFEKKTHEPPNSEHLAQRYSETGKESPYKRKYSAKYHPFRPRDKGEYDLSCVHMNEDLPKENEQEYADFMSKKTEYNPESAKNFLSIQNFSEFPVFALDNDYMEALSKIFVSKIEGVLNLVQCKQLLCKQLIQKSLARRKVTEVKKEAPRQRAKSQENKQKFKDYQKEIEQLVYQNEKKKTRDELKRRKAEEERRIQEEQIKLAEEKKKDAEMQMRFAEEQNRNTEVQRLFKEEEGRKREEELEKAKKEYEEQEKKRLEAIELEKRQNLHEERELKRKEENEKLDQLQREMKELQENLAKKEAKNKYKRDQIASEKAADMQLEAKKNQNISKGARILKRAIDKLEVRRHFNGFKVKVSDIQKSLQYLENLIAKVDRIKKVHVFTKFKSFVVDSRADAFINNKVLYLKTRIFLYLKKLQVKAAKKYEQAVV